MLFAAFLTNCNSQSQSDKKILILKKRNDRTNKGDRKLCAFSRCTF